MTILWGFDEKHPEQVSAYGAASLVFRPTYGPRLAGAGEANVGHLSCSSAVRYGGVEMRAVSWKRFMSMPAILPSGS